MNMNLYSRFGRKSFLFAWLIFAHVGLVFAQESPKSNESKTKADENFTLNIMQERTSETNFERSKSVQIGGNNQKTDLLIRVGAAVSAQKIDLTLRGITGSGRFRASLEIIERLIKRRDAPKSPAEP